MRRTIEIETSRFSENPTKRWVGGLDYVVEDVCIEYPPELDNLENDELLELADNDDRRVRYIKAGVSESGEREDDSEIYELAKKDILLFSTGIEVEFEVFCASCGDGLCRVSEVRKTQRRGINYVEVSPCPKCMKREREEGYDLGYDQGLREGI